MPRYETVNQAEKLRKGDRVWIAELNTTGRIRRVNGFIHHVQPEGRPDSFTTEYLLHEIELIDDRPFYNPESFESTSGFVVTAFLAAAAIAGIALVITVLLRGDLWR